jgi:hypothetical protein
MNNFVEFVQNRMQSLGFSYLINADQTNVDFDMENSRRVIARRGVRTVAKQVTGSSARCTVMLAATSSGVKLPPFVVFKGKPGARVEREVAAFDCQSVVQEKAWFDEAVMGRWIDTCLIPYLGVGRCATMLLLDHFKVHTLPSIGKKLSNAGVDVMMIPAGYTSVLQPMDIGCNKPFKDRLTELYDIWFVEVSNDEVSLTFRIAPITRNLRGP